ETIEQQRCALKSPVRRILSPSDRRPGRQIRREAYRLVRVVFGLSRVLSRSRGRFPGIDLPLKRLQFFSDQSQGVGTKEKMHWWVLGFHDPQQCAGSSGRISRLLSTLFRACLSHRIEE